MLTCCQMSSGMTPHTSATLALEAYRSRLGSVLSFIDDAVSARIQLPTDAEELSRTLNGLLEYFLAGEAAFTASGAELDAHRLRVCALHAANAALRREEAHTVLLLQALQLAGAAVDDSASMHIDKANALRSAAAAGSSGRLRRANMHTKQNQHTSRPPTGRRRIACMPSSLSSSSEYL